MLNNHAVWSLKIYPCLSPIRVVHASSDTIVYYIYNEESIVLLNTTRDMSFTNIICVCVCVCVVEYNYRYL